MPYVRCPSCGTTAYTAARFSTVDECPRCARSLRGARRATVDPARLRSADAGRREAEGRRASCADSSLPDVRVRPA